MFAVVLLLLMPELRENNLVPWQVFTTTETKQQPLSYAKAVRLAGPAVVNIYSEDIQVNPTYGRQSRKVTLGSGVIMHNQGYILTNYHVVQSADLIVVVLQRGQELHAELIGYDVLTDLAVLKVQASNLPVIPQNNSLTSQVGDVVLAIGNINEGNSGGALINSNGELVGINSRKFTQANPNLNIQGIFFAVPYQLAHKIMLKIIEHGRVIRGWLGVEANDSVASIKGFVIGAVTPQSPAMKAGLQSGDVVYQIGDIQVQNAKQGLDVVAEASPGSVLNFMVSRDNQKLILPVTIAEVTK